MATKKTRKEFTIPEQELMVKTEMFEYYVKILNKKHTDDGSIGGTWVTDVEWSSPKTFYYKAEKRAYAFSSLGSAMDFTFALACHGFSAVVEVVPTWTGMREEYLTNPKEEK